jgi:hypothetical protein
VGLAIIMDLTNVNRGSCLPTLQRVCPGGRPDIGSPDNPCWGSARYVVPQEQLNTKNWNQSKSVCELLRTQGD